MRNSAPWLLNAARRTLVTAFPSLARPADEWALERLERTPGLRWSAETADDWRTAPEDHVVTRYEEKRLGDTPPIFLEFERV